MFFVFGQEKNSSTQNFHNLSAYSNSDSIKLLYSKIFHESLIDYKVFEQALYELKLLNSKNKLANDTILTIIDYTKNCNQERFFIIDLKNTRLLKNTLVAHGKNSGVYIASNFSNMPKSHKSSLGTFITGNTYNGKHGYSLRLDGIDKGLNDNARQRAIVIHGASYVSEDFINRTGRIGRSFGCPALPIEENKEIINLIKNQSCLYIFHPSLNDTTLAVQSQKVL